MRLNKVHIGCTYRTIASSSDDGDGNRKSQTLYQRGLDASPNTAAHLCFKWTALYGLANVPVVENSLCHVGQVPAV